MTGQPIRMQKQDTKHKKSNLQDNIKQKRNVPNNLVPSCMVFADNHSFQAVQSDVFLSDCKSFFHDAASFLQTFIGWTIDAGQSVAQISTKIPNEIIAGIIYWLLMILVVGICVAGTGILAILIEIKVIELYKKNCWDVITLLMILTSTAVIIYFGEAIKKALSVNLLLLFVLSQGVYLGIRCYLKNRLGTKQYW